MPNDVGGDQDKIAEVVRDKWPRRILYVMGVFVTLFILLKGCLWFVVPNGGHMFDTYEVMSVLPRSDGELNAVEYKYMYAELSKEGKSVWFTKSKAPAVGSKKLASGEPAFTYVSTNDDINWKWNDEGELEVSISGSADILIANWPSSCFWGYTAPKLCLHSQNVIVKK